MTSSLSPSYSSKSKHDIVGRRQRGRLVLRMEYDGWYIQQGCYMQTWWLNDLEWKILKIGKTVCYCLCARIRNILLGYDFDRLNQALPHNWPFIKVCVGLEFWNRCVTKDALREIRFLCRTHGSDDLLRRDSDEARRCYVVSKRKAMQYWALVNSKSDRKWTYARPF